MKRQIKLVWLLSIVTMVFILCGQCYWLYLQYVYNTEAVVRQMQQDCDSILTEETGIRYAQYYERNIQGKTWQTQVIIQTTDSLKQLPKVGYRGTTQSTFTFRFYAEDSTEVEPFKGMNHRVTLINVSPDQSSDYLNRYLSSLLVPFNKPLLDSLLHSRGYGEAVGVQFHRSQKVHIPAEYGLSGKFLKQLHVKFTHNPFNYEYVLFAVPVPVSSVIRQMAWPLAGSLLLMAVLAVCLGYQVRTILIQKRIDDLRREFLKNMIYEMKQPVEESDTNEVLRLGNTLFYYTQNELRHDHERVIITSRQAEILRLLATHPNEVVLREDILRQVWGDDSYANSLALNVQITYLRRALRSDHAITLEAVIKRGYILRT